MNKIVDKHAPIKLASQSKQRHILNLVKRKQKMYRA